MSDMQQIGALPPRTLLDAMGDLRRAKLYIIAGAALGLLCAFLFLTVQPSYYRAQMVVEPANPMAKSGASAFQGDNDLASSGAPGGAFNTADFMRFETMISGPDVAAIMLQDSHIVKGLPASAAQSPEKLAEYIQKRVRVEPVGQTPQRRLTYYDPDATFAAYFLSSLHNIADEKIRAVLRADAERRLRYLKQAYDANENPDQRRMITSLLAEQERLIMLISIDQPYAAAVVAPATASSKPAWPDKRIAFAALVFAGALAGFAAYGLRHGAA